MVIIQLGNHWNYTRDLHPVPVQEVLCPLCSKAEGQGVVVGVVDVCVPCLTLRQGTSATSQ